MSEKDQDKIATQTELKSSEAGQSVLDQQDNSQAAESSENAQKEPGNDPLNKDPEASDNSNDDQPVAEAPEEGNDINDAVAADNTESVADDLNAEKESKPTEKNEKTRSSAEDSGDKQEDDSLTDVESDDSSESAASKSSIKDKEADSSEEKQNDTIADNAEKDRFEQKPNDTEEETEDLPELEPKKKIPLLKASLTVILVVAVFSGFFIFDNKSNIKSAKKTESKEVSKALSDKASQKNTKATLQPDDPNYMYYSKIDEISRLREKLLRKKEEILELKNHYQSGIEELQKEILDELRHLTAVTFLQAIENKRIEFGLQTIQRRLAYIQQLDRPAEWVFQAGEDLLYIKRKALMDIQVAEVASGIDMNMHVRHMNSALNKYRPTADKLAIDMTDAHSESLESIWQQIQNKSLDQSSQLAHSKNQIISEQICTGKFSRLSELSEISVDSAKCIVEMQGSDLFLNGLTEISPRAARHLFEWKGNWICLNGFRALSPRVAAYLFEWEGDWISLNGLTDFSPEIGNMLLQWSGNQLELMGLRYTDGSAGKIGIRYLAQWERSGGKLFVPKTIRKEIDNINRGQRPPA